MATPRRERERAETKGRGARERIKFTSRVPIGVEKVLYLAATRPEFRRRLAEDRPAAVAAAKVRLTDAERATLLGVPARALETMIDRLRPAEHGRRRFMKTVAAATVSLAASMVTESCTMDAAGIDPGDYVEPRDDVTTTEDTGDEDAAEGIDAESGLSDTAEVPVPDYAEDGIRPDGGE